MGSFFLTSKKASATLVFLVISIIIVSSGVIIVNEVEKSNNENNVAGTGLVLLNTEQENSQYSDSSDDQITFTFGDSERKSSSKKSSGGGGGSSGSGSQTYNEPEIPIDDEIADNQTSENQTDTNYTGEINESGAFMKNGTAISSCEVMGPIVGTCESLVCDDGIYETNEGPGGAYCCGGSGSAGYEECTHFKRKSTAAVPGATSKTDYCSSGEVLQEAYIDCKWFAKDQTLYYQKDCNELNYNVGTEYYCSGNYLRKRDKTYDHKCSNGACTFDKYTYSNNQLVENCNDRDEPGEWVYYCSGNQVLKHRRYYNYGCSGGSCYLVSNYYVDDTLVSKKGDIDYCSKRKQYGCTLCSHGDYDCDSDSECSSGLVCLGPTFDWNPSYYDGCCNSVNEYWNTTTHTCKQTIQCTSGVCCDLSTSQFKLYPSQPTGYTDDTNGLCSGSSNSETTCSNSPTGTCYVLTKNYYCNGEDADAHVSYALKDTCGTCEYCTNNDLTCNYYPSSTTCSSLQDCDYLNNYHITGIPGAKSISYCKYKDYNDNYKYCNGVGSCSSLTCPLGSDTTTATAGTCKYISGCSGSTPGTVKNYASGTSCGTNKECDGFGSCIITCTNECFSGQTRCSGNYKQTCGNYDADNCLEWPSSTSGNGNEYCTYGCSNGQCNSEIACYNDSDCNDSNQYTEDICNDAATPQSSCSYLPIACLTDTDCDDSDPYTEDICNDAATPQSSCSYLPIACLTDTDCDDSDPYTEDVCNDAGTAGSSCSHLPIACIVDIDCGENGTIGDPWCSNDDVWQNYVNYTCNYAGTGNSYCSNSTAPNLKEPPCGSDYCENWGGNYCNLDDVYHERICHDKGCSGGACFDDTYIEEEKVEECGTSEHTGNNYCYNEDVYRDYITRTCSNSRCTSSTSEKKTEDCAHGCISGRCKIKICKIICNFGTCYEYCVWQ